MNIDDLTLGDARKLAKLFCSSACNAKMATGRVVLVVDRGWIFAGDASVTTDEHIRLDRAVHIFRWESIGFAKMLEDWKSDKVDLRSIASVEVPRNSIIFRIPVDAEWGLKK